MPITSTSVLPFANYNGDRYCYFAVERNGKLSTFGGHKKRSESTVEAAAREFKEESLGVFGHRKRKIIKKLSNRQKTIRFKTDHHVTFFTRYRVKHDQDIIQKFQSIRQRKWSSLHRGQKEITKIVAVKKATLINNLKNKIFSFEGHTLRNCVKTSLTKALEHGVLERV